MAAQLPGHFGRMTLSASSRSAPASGRGSPAESVVIEETSFDGVAGIVAWAEISVEEALKQQHGQEQIGCRICQSITLYMYKTHIILSQNISDFYPL